MSSARRPAALRNPAVRPDRVASPDSGLAGRGAVWWVRRVALSLVLGALLGLATQRSIGLGAAMNEAFAKSAGPWAIAAALVGRWAPNVRTAVVTATVCLWAATVAFYAAGGPPGAGTPGFWLAMTVSVGPLLGWLGRASATSGWPGAIAAGIIAGWLTGEVVNTALGYGGASRWLGVAVNGAAAACWVGAARGPRRVVAATMVPMTAAPVVFLAAVELASGPTFH